jgi:hypothetical protein
MISKETTNSIGYQATDASSKSSTVSRPTSRNITAEADPSNKNKSHISGTQVSRYTASSRPSEPTIPPFQKSSKSEQHSQKMSSNRIHGYQRSHSHRTNSVTSGGSKQTRSNPKKKVETNHDSTLNPVRSHTKDTSVTSPTKRKSRRRRNQAKSKPSSSTSLSLLYQKITCYRIPRLNLRKENHAPFLLLAHQKQQQQPQKTLTRMNTLLRSYL